MSRATSSGGTRRRFAEKEGDQARNAEVIKQILLRGAALSKADPSKPLDGPSPGPGEETPADG